MTAYSNYKVSINSVCRIYFSAFCFLKFIEMYDDGILLHLHFYKLRAYKNHEARWFLSLKYSHDFHGNENPVLRIVLLSIRAK